MWMLEQLRDLRDEKGYDVAAIIAAGEGKLTERLKEEGIPYHSFDFEFPSAHGWRSLLDRVLELAALLRRERYDIVQTHLFASMVLGRLAAWLADCPLRFAMIAGPFHLEAYTPRWIDASTCWMETGVIGSCRFTKTLYEQLGVDAGKISVIYYGPDEHKFASEIEPVDLKHEFNLPAAAPLVGMVAYFYPRLPANRWIPDFLHDKANKRQEDLIAAFPHVLQRYPEARLFLVGSGWGEAGEAELSKARTQVAALGISERVIFTGYRKDVNRILMSLDVSVQGALSENLGGTIESLLMERPTVATRTGGLVDSIRDGETGVLVEPMNPLSMAQGILRLLDDPIAARRMAAAGRELMLRDFTLSKTVSDLDALYASQFARTSGRGYRLWVTLMRGLIAVPVFTYLAARLAIDAKLLPQWDAGWRPFPIPQYHAKQSVRTAFDIHRAERGRNAYAWLKQQPHNTYCYARQLRLRSIRRRCRRRILRADRRRRAYAWLKLQPLYGYGYVRYLLRGTQLLRKWDVFFARVRGRRPYTEAELTAIHDRPLTQPPPSP